MTAWPTKRMSNPQFGLLARLQLAAAHVETGGLWPNPAAPGPGPRPLHGFKGAAGEHCHFLYKPQCFISGQQEQQQKALERCRLNLTSKECLVGRTNEWNRISASPGTYFLDSSPLAAAMLLPVKLLAG